MKKLMLTFLAGASLANADCNPDFCHDVYIDTLYPVYEGTVYVATSGDESVLNCNAASGQYVTLKADHKGADRIYSTLLAAQISGKKINSIQVDDNSTGCVIQYVTLNRQ